MIYESEEVCYINYPKKNPLVLEGVSLTAQNIWKNRDYWIQKVFEHYRAAGFPYPQMSEEEIIEEVNKLKKKNPNEVLTDINEIKNSSNLCLDVCRYVNNNCFWECKGESTPSIMEAFNNDELLMKVLKNRMGYARSNTDWQENGKWYKAGAYYLFDMSDDMLLQGFRSSMIGFSTSNFKPLIAKYLINKYCDGNFVLDLSTGWSARYLASYSLNKVYYGIDPSPVTKNTKELAYLLGDSESKFFKGGSEDSSLYRKIGRIDYVISCPPYYTLESYYGGEQSTSLYNTYESWLENFWKPTCINATSKLRKGGKFTLIMIEDYRGKKLLKDMTSILCKVGNYKEIERIPYKTCRSHMTKKAGNTKNSEVCVTYELC